MIQNIEDNKKLDFDINIVPILDCFTVLITFLLVSVSFISIGYFNTKPALLSESTQTNPNKIPDVGVEIFLQNPFQIKIQFTENSTESIVIPSNNTEWNIEAFVKIIEKIKTQYPTLESMTLSADDSISYDTIIQFMEPMNDRNLFVFLGGFYP